MKLKSKRKLTNDTEKCQKNHYMTTHLKTKKKWINSYKPTPPKLNHVNKQSEETSNREIEEVVKISQK